MRKEKCRGYDIKDRIRKEKWSKSLHKQRYEEKVEGNERLDGGGRKRYKNINLKRF